jgi:hypothetical protein
MLNMAIGLPGCVWGFALLPFIALSNSHLLMMIENPFEELEGD